MTSRTKILILISAILMAGLMACDGATGNTRATDPTERGLSYIAAAIVTSAVLRAIFNK